MEEIAQVLVDDKTYNVIKVISGGMGRVWLLEQAFEDLFDPIYRHRIAVKTFDFFSDEKAIMQELNIWISLKHQFILPLSKIGRLNYRLAAIMPLLQGSLDDVLKLKGSLSELETSTIILSMVMGLEYAWSNFKILHLDLKPSNVLIEEQNKLRIKIADWGISRLVEEHNMRSSARWGDITNGVFDQRTSYKAGTPLFMAPERFKGDWQLSPAADIYSLGLIAFQLNTGILPFQFGKINPVNEIVSGSFFENARIMLSDRNERFRCFCLGCIDPRPKCRPSKYRDIIEQLASILNER